MKDLIIKLLATVFYVGYFPFAPGTMGSLIGVLVCMLTRDNLWVYISLTIFLIVIGLIVSDKAQVILGRKDDKRIVIDEACGILTAYLFISPTLFNLVAGFALFRFFDILKPYPIKQLEKLNGGWGVMLDDLAAGVYAGIILALLHTVKLT